MNAGSVRETRDGLGGPSYNERKGHQPRAHPCAGVGHLRGPVGEGDGLIPHSRHEGIRSPALVETHSAFGGRCRIAGGRPMATDDRVSASGDPSDGLILRPCLLPVLFPQFHHNGPVFQPRKFANVPVPRSPGGLAPPPGRLHFADLPASLSSGGMRIRPWRSSSTYWA